MKRENTYEFRNKLLSVHEKDVRDPGKVIPQDAVLLRDGAVIEIGGTDDIVIRTAAEDFADFLAVSMGISASVSCTGLCKGDNVVQVGLAAENGVELGVAEGYKGFLIRPGEGIQVFGHDARGAQQGLFYMEDLMCMNKAPYLLPGEIRKKAMFAPQMVHSGYGMEMWPDEYLMRIAHEGRDAIMVFVTDVNQTRVGYLDFNDLIARANRCGLDVYAYSFFMSELHPDEPGAEELCENTYGRLFRECPGFAGVTFVGEVMEFHSKDPHVSKFRYEDVVTDPIPSGKPKPGWYPCEDLPQWINMVKKVIRKYKPTADIVLWSYNWGYQAEEARIKLIENLPDDISFQATFEMFENWKLEKSHTGCSDYTLAIPGPGKYFTSEAKAIKKRGMRLYTMSQSAGVTWDFGVIPYEPMPYQWIKRFQEMVKAKENWGLCGGMDCHHHGMYPSIITKLSKHAFMEPAEPMEEILDKIMMCEYGQENLEKCRQAFKLWSDAICHYIPTSQQLGGAGRVGPAYPLNLFYTYKLPYDKDAMFGARVISHNYTPSLGDLFAKPRYSVLSLRIHEEIRSFEKMLELMNQGIQVFESIENKNEKLLNMINLGKFIATCVATAIHAKQWFVLKCRMHAEFTKEGLLGIYDEMEALVHKEAANAESAVPLIDADSRLGWEPSMLYLCDREHLDLKQQQLAYVLKEIDYLRKCLDLTDD